jgi:hypothetical protein
LTSSALCAANASILKKVLQIVNIYFSVVAETQPPAPASRQPLVSATVAVAKGSARASRAAVDASSTATADDGVSSVTRGGACAPQPIFRLTFKDDALRQFIYACWKRFLTEHSRQKKWTKGKKPEAIYPLLVNTLEPLVYFALAAGDNLRAIRDVMKVVASEAGSADLAAIESEIKKLDAGIDQRVYDLCGLTPRRSQNRGERSAVIYTLLGSCRRHGLNPFDYLRDLFTRLPAAKITQIREFTPAAWFKAKAKGKLVAQAA